MAAKKKVVRKKRVVKKARHSNAKAAFNEAMRFAMELQIDQRERHHELTQLLSRVVDALDRQADIAQQSVEDAAERYAQMRRMDEWLKAFYAYTTARDCVVMEEGLDGSVVVSDMAESEARERIAQAHKWGALSDKMREERWAAENAARKAEASKKAEPSVIADEGGDQP